MLVLKRRPGQDVIINHDIVVRVLEINGRGEVKLGIAAPPGIPIHRKEIEEAIKKDGFRSRKKPRSR